MAGDFLEDERPCGGIAVPSSYRRMCHALADYARCCPQGTFACGILYCKWSAGTTIPVEKMLTYMN